MRIDVLLAAVVVVGVWVGAAGAEAAMGDSEKDLAVVRERLYASRVQVSENARKGIMERADTALASIRADGSWADQDYADTNRENWKCGAHLARVVTLATAARQPEVAGERQKEFLVAAVNGLRYWLTVDPKNTNWWHNEIGVPMNVGDILVILGGDAPTEVRERGVELMRRSKWAKWTGQNLVWGTKIQIVRSCIAGDAKAAAEAFDRMYEEVRVAPGQEEGIKQDRSFFQHGPLLYSGGYGAVFSNDTARLAALGAGTAWAMPKEKLDLLVSYLLDGQAWMVRGRYWDYSVTGREIVRKGKAAGSLAGAADDLASLVTERKAELQGVAARIRGAADAPALSGNRHFWCADYMTHVRPGWFASARMYSARTMNTDGLINGENKQSHHLADGVTYILLKGDEYEDIFPVWDWHKIPGSTVEQGAVLEPAKVNHRGTEKFVGGVSDGMYGCATMDLTTGTLHAMKSWFFFDEGFVALGAGINCSTDNEVVTTINQCLLRGEVRADRIGRVDRGGHHLDAGEWVWHGQVGYVPLAPAAMVLKVDAQKGNWNAIGTGGSAPISRDVFALTIGHGARPADAGYAYLVLPAVSAKETAAAARNLPVKVVSNTTELQAVWHEGLGMMQAIFRKAGSVMAGRVQVAVDRPCAMMVRIEGQKMQITVADPAREAGEVMVTIGARVEAPGAEVMADGTTRVKVMLPGGEEAGKSVSITGRLVGG